MSSADASASRIAGSRGEPENFFTQLYRRLQTGMLDPAGRIVMLDAIVGVFMIARVAIPGLPIPLPLADTAILLLVLISVFRRPRLSETRTLLFGLAAVALVAYLVIVTFLDGGDFLRRSVRIFALVGLAIFIGDGRINVRSLAFGAALGLALNIPLFYAGIAPAYYGEYLTGYLGDKNLAGLYYAIFPLIVAGLMRSNGARWIVLGIGAVAVLLTGSRTSLAALAIGVVWLIATRRMIFPVRVGFGVLLYLIFDFVENNFARLGYFVDREGTDALRGRIDAASLEKLAQSPWYGQGLGSAFVEENNYTWFFHNSYWALLVEGGWPFLVTILAIFLFVVFIPGAASGVRSTQRVAIEAAAIAMLLCSFRLGEVFITIPAFFMLGSALFLLAEEKAMLERSSAGLVDDAATSSVARST